MLLYNRNKNSGLVWRPPIVQISLEGCYVFFERSATSTGCRYDAARQ